MAEAQAHVCDPGRARAFWDGDVLTCGCCKGMMLLHPRRLVEYCPVCRLELVAQEVAGRV